MKHQKNQFLACTIANLSVSVILTCGLLFSSNSLAGEMKAVPQQAQLIDWSEEVSVSLASKMDNKLNEIVIQAEYIHDFDDINKLATLGQQDIATNN